MDSMKTKVSIVRAMIFEQKEEDLKMVKAIELENYILVVEKDRMEVIWKVSDKAPDWPEIVAMAEEIVEYGQPFLKKKR